MRGGGRFEVEADLRLLLERCDRVTLYFISSADVDGLEFGLTVIESRCAVSHIYSSNF